MWERTKKKIGPTGPFSHFEHLDPENQNYCSIYREMLATKVRHSSHSFGLYLELYIWFPISYFIFKFVSLLALDSYSNFYTRPGGVICINMDINMLFRDVGFYIYYHCAQYLYLIQSLDKCSEYSSRSLIYGPILSVISIHLDLGPGNGSINQMQHNI